MKDYSEVNLGELQDEYEDMLYPFICDGDYNGVYNGEKRFGLIVAQTATSTVLCDGDSREIVMGVEGE